MPISLLYHDVTAPDADDESGFAGPEAARYKLTTTEFARHVDAISRQVTSLRVATTIEELNRTEADSWLITFDDGGVSSITRIADQLESRGWRGWFFIATDFIGATSFCSRNQIRELHDRGHVIGSHSCSHPQRISDCSHAELLSEWSRSRDVLEQITGMPVLSASVPGGFYSRRVAQAAVEGGYKVLFNSEPTTSIADLNGCKIVGRFNVYRGMPAIDAASLVSSPLRRWRQAAFWNAKKVAKTIAGPAYKSIRKQLLRRAYATTSR